MSRTTQASSNPRRTSRSPFGVCFMVPCVVVLGSLVATGGGCGTTPQLRAEAIAATDTLGSPGADSDVRSIRFTVEATNPGPEPISLETVRYRVIADGRTIAEATREAERVVGRYATQSFELPAVLPENAPPGPYRVEGIVAYVPPGVLNRILFDEGYRRPTVSFASE
ncbi:MAG: hypothetical protein SFZ23_06060 [Planctomycetota bacterium]|nr:hypothetical protein [Planctomycetota bacterium]